MSLTQDKLAQAILSLQLEPELIELRASQIRMDVLKTSGHMKDPNFRSIHSRDLEFLFDSYDSRFLAGLVRRSLEGAPLRFRLSPRMTRSGGTTTRFRSRTGAVRYEIAIASSMLFDGFGDEERDVTVCGWPCATRLEALQRIFEHELVHLCEQVCWGNSNCSGTRFQEIASRLFLHRAHTHSLVTRRERAAESGIRPGVKVVFECEGRRLIGVVNRITKRATVLVEDPTGRKFSDGLRYLTYYVPLLSLEVVKTTSSAF